MSVKTLGVTFSKRCYWVAVRPPSRVRICPVTNDDASEQKNRTAPTRSSVSAMRSQRDAPDEVVVEGLVGEQALDLRRAHERGRDGVDGDLVLGPFGRLLAGDRVDRALRGDVRHVAGVDAELAADAGDVQHAAAVAGLDHVPRRGLGHEQVAAQVEVHDPVPLVLGIFLGRVQGGAGAAADGVDHDVDAAKVVGGLVDRRVDFVPAW